MTEKQRLQTIVILSCLPMERPIPLMSGLWPKVETLFHPFPPPLSKGALLLEVRSLADRGWVTLVDGARLVSRTYAGHVELQEQILHLQEGAWSVEKAFLILQVGFFYLAGRIELEQPVVEFIQSRMVEASNYYPHTVKQPTLFEGVS